MNAPARITSPLHDTAAAISFLQRLDPDGWHNLVAIDPESGKTEGATFAPGQWAPMADWMAPRQGRKNLYYMPNEPAPEAPDRKLKKHHVAKIRAVFVDIDPDPDAVARDGFGAERRRLLAKIETFLRDAELHDAAPTGLTDSGNGFQLVWRLQEKRDADKFAPWAEAQSYALAQRLDGDSVHNVDRILRLPGTMNLPNAKKRDNGRVPSLAKLMAWEKAAAPEDVSAFCQPIAPPANNSPDADAETALVQARLEASDYREAANYADLDADLRRRFKNLLASRPKVAALWQGDRSAFPGEDETGSGFRAALAGSLNSAGWDPVDYARLCWIWDHATQNDRDEKLAPRALARDWARMGPLGRPDAEDEFDAVEIPEAPAASGSKRERRIFSFADAVAHAAEARNREHLVKDILLGGTLSVMYGDSNSGKTFIALALAYAIAADQRFLGRKVSPGAVLYVAAEGGQGIFNRMVALERHFGATDAPLFVAPIPVDLLNGGSDAKFLVEQCSEIAAKHGKPVRLIIIDTLSRALAGGDENSSVDMGKFVRHADDLRERTGAAVMIVHHTGKDKSRGARGHSLLRAATDTEIEIEAKPAEKRSTFEVTKQRDLDRIPPAQFRLQSIKIGVDADLESITSCVAVQLEGPVREELQGNLAILFDALRDLGAEDEASAVSEDEWHQEANRRWPRSGRGRKRVQIDLDEPLSKNNFRRNVRNLSKSGHVAQTLTEQWFAARAV